VWLEVVDAYEHGAGSLALRPWGAFTASRSAGRDVSIGEAMRYLAELAWVPHAITENPALEWREVEQRSVQVSLAVEGERRSVRYEFDEAGDVVRVWTAARPRVEGSRLWIEPGVGRSVIMPSSGR
jgi:Family of unknown function (DUF6544)